MRGLFADLYKDAGTTQAVVSIGYWVEDVRDSDYFTLDDLEKIREVFADEIARSRDLVVEHQGIFAEIVDRVRSVMHFMFLYVEL